MTILFVNQHTGTGTLPLASACLASALEARFGNQTVCPIMELEPGFNRDETVREILASGPDILALTLYSWSRADLLSLAAAVQTASQELRPMVIAGGPEVTADPSAVQNHPAINLAVSGEGELALVEIVRILLPLSVPGRPAALASFPAPFSMPAVENLDSLPSPWNALAIAGRRYDDTVWELTRGCPFGCHFCFESKGSGRVRHKSPERAAMELRQIRDRGAGNVFLLDPTFNASPGRARELLKLFIREAPGLNFHMEVRTEFLDEEQAELYGELGCTLQIGLQTSHPEVASAIGRPFSPDSFMEKLYPLHENAVPYGLDLIYGLPGDSLEGFRQSLNFALSCAPNHLDIFPLSVLPGTRLSETAGRLGLHYLKSAPYTVVGNPENPAGFSEDDLTEAAGLAESVNELYNKGRAVPWFLSVSEALEMDPVEIVQAFRSVLESDAAPDVREFVGQLAAEHGHPELSDIIRDVTGLFAAESKGSDEITAFVHNPNSLMEHLEMGITDMDELRAFAAREPGVYRRSGNAGDPIFIRAGSAES